MDFASRPDGLQQTVTEARNSMRAATAENGQKRSDAASKRNAAQYAEARARSAS